MKKTLLIALFSGILMAGLSACGSHEDLSYEYTANGCATGKHEFENPLFVVLNCKLPFEQAFTDVNVPS